MPAVGTEIAAWEHSEPGTGPIPNYQHSELDKAIVGGWRRESPPAAFPEHYDPFQHSIFVTMNPIPFESR